MMEKEYFFISGLPRSGSTLLSALLLQNPEFSAGISSPVGGITQSLKMITSQNIEIDYFLNENHRSRLFRSVFNSYYETNPKPVIFDTHRTWAGRINELMHVFENVKVISMVRNPAWILNSLEVIFQKAPLRASSLSQPNLSSDARLDRYMGPDGVVGGPLGSLKDGLYNSGSENLLLVDYDAFCLQTKKVMQSIYAFCGKEYFDHDFENVNFSQDGFDETLRTPGLHVVKGPVRQQRKKTILSPDTFIKYSNYVFWKGDIPTKASRILID